MSKLRTYKGKEISKELDETLNKVKFFVEADNFSQFALWEKWSKDSTLNKNVDKDRILIPWEEKTGISGFGVTLGFIEYEGDTYPIVIQINFAKLNGILVCFYYGSSAVVHHELIYDFMRTNWPIKYDKNTRYAYTDAQNFHHCVNFCLEPRNQRYKLTTHEYD